TESKPAIGLPVSLVARDSASGTAALLPARPSRTTKTEGDGTYRIDDLPSGTYAVEAKLNGVEFASKSTTIAVSDQPISVNMEFKVGLVSGRIVWDDGSPFMDDAVNQVAVSTTDNPNFIQTILIPISRQGAFGKSIEAGDYRIFIRNLPEQYKVTSV